MTISAPLRHALLAPAIAALIAVAPCRAQLTRPLAPNPLPADLVKTGLYLISGGGCNSLLRLSAGGLILVDGKLPGSYAPLLDWSTRISKQPIRILILTGPQDQNTGNDAEFLHAGAAILAHRNLASHLKPGAPQPSRTFDRDFTIQLGGVEVRTFHFGNARTDADAVVYFPNLKTVAVGGLLAPIPDPDYSLGGSLAGWGPVLAQLLNLDFDTVVPAAGPVASRADLAAFKSKIDTLTARARALIAASVPKDRFLAQWKTADLGWRFHFSPAEIDRLYDDLSAPR